MSDETEEIMSAETEVLLVDAFEVLQGVVGGMDTVILVLEANNGVDVGHLTFALPSEDAKLIATRLSAIAATVRPIQAQIRNQEASQV